MEPRISFIALGVADFARAIDFYSRVLQLPIRSRHDDIVIFDLVGLWFSVSPVHVLAEDVGKPLTTPSPNHYRDFTFAHNVGSKDAVDSLLAHIKQHGGTVVTPPSYKSWGGYSGYFADPDSFLWEVAWNPHLLPPSEI